MVVIPEWLRWYKRPQWRDIREYTAAVNNENQNQLGHHSRNASQSSVAIPSRLELERVLQNKTCSPMSLHDFYMYLKYIEMSSENLEFYLWFRNYASNYPMVTERSSNVNEKELPLPPIPLPNDVVIRDAASTFRFSHVSSVEEIKRGKETLSMISESTLSAESSCALAARRDAKFGDLFFHWTMATSRGTTDSHPMKCYAGRCIGTGVDEEQAIGTGKLPLLYSKRNENRAELDAAIATFLLPGSEKELNISSQMRMAALARLEKSSDPIYLQPIADHIFEIMKNCSHRNFISIGVLTGTYETVCVGNLLGILNIVAAFALVFARAFGSGIGAHTRWEVFYAFPLWMMGTTLILVGTQGMCFIMLSLSRRQTLPWERFEDKESEARRATRSSFRRFMDRTMANDPNFRVQDVHLRRLQRIILIQCKLYGILGGFAGVLICIFLPIWRETVPQAGT